MANADFGAVHKADTGAFSEAYKIQKNIIGANTLCSMAIKDCMTTVWETRGEDVCQRRTGKNV